MSLALDTEVILTEILAANEAGDGVSYTDIRKFCNEVKCALFAEAEGVKCISFDISKNDLTKCVKVYPRQFRIFDGRYYRGSSYDPGLFKSRNEERVNEIMERVANSMQIA